MNSAQFKVSTYAKDIQSTVMMCDSMRQDKDKPKDISIAQFVTKRWGITMETLYADLGIDPTVDTIANIFTLPDASVRFLVPEIIREALRLGLRKNPIYPSIIAAEQPVKQLSFTQPWINMSDAMPEYVNEAETIPTGSLSYGQKTVKIRKLGKGIKIPYEVRDYVAINIVAIFLQDMGVKLGQGIDGLLIDTLINGEQTDGSESAPVIGIAVVNTLTYNDILKVWIRMSRLGRLPSAIIGGETAAISTLSLTEFKQPQPTGGPIKDLNIKTPIPQSMNYFIHGRVPANQQILVDPSATVIKYNAQPLLVETDKIVSNQTDETYASLTTGFGIVFRDGRAILDSSVTIGASPFPSYMDVDAIENVTFS